MNRSLLIVVLLSIWIIESTSINNYHTYLAIGKRDEKDTYSNALINKIFHNLNVDTIEIPYEYDQLNNTRRIDQILMDHDLIDGRRTASPSHPYILKNYHENTSIICDESESIKSANECFVAANLLGYDIDNINKIQLRDGKEYNWAAHGCFRYGLDFYYFNNNIYELHPTPTSTYKHRDYICIDNNNNVQMEVDSNNGIDEADGKQRLRCPRVIEINTQEKHTRYVLTRLVKQMIICNPPPLLYFRYISKDDDDTIITNLLAEFCPRKKYEKPYTYNINHIICIPTTSSYYDEGAILNNNINDIKSHLNHIPNKTIIQIGSHVGNTINDPIFEMADENTNLILIEPVPFLFERLKRNYKMKLPNHFHNIIFINKAVADFIGEIEFTIPSANNDFQNLPYWVTQLGSTNANHLKKHLPDLVVETIKVKTTTINEIVKNYQLKDIYLLKTDAEGMDYRILMNYDFSKYIKPMQILFEHNHMDGTFTVGKNYQSLMSKLEHFGYKMVIDANNYYRLGGSKADTLMELHI